MRYARKIKYRSEGHGHVDFATWSTRSRANHSRRLLPAFGGLAALALGVLIFAQRVPTEPLPSRPISDEPRERIGVRIPGKSLEESQDQLLARLPFEPRIPDAADVGPRMLPETSRHSDDWHTVQIRPGDSLSVLLNRIGVTANDAQRVLAAASKNPALRKIMAGQSLAYLIQEGELHELAYEVDRFNTLRVKKQGTEYSTELVKLEADVKLASATGEITRSLFVDGQAAGLSDRLIMEFSNLFGWDIDFVLEMRRGDRFKVIYEEMYRAGEKIGNGRILGAEFTNRGKTFRAIYFKGSDGSEGYYTDKGESMRKAFLRAPLDFTRISSRFNLSRRHPILNRIRAHRGVDYAAPMGTPIRAVADGKVEFVGTQNGYGNVIVLKHGDKYSTLYGHMQRFAKNVRRGGSVSQGQLIGYVGKSGLATGPHLHYEFRVGGVHRDPLTVTLPRSLAVAPKFLAEFNRQTKQTIALLDAIDDQTDLVGTVANADSTPTRDTEKDL